VLQFNLEQLVLTMTTELHCFEPEILNHLSMGWFFLHHSINILAEIRLRNITLLASKLL